MAINKFFVLTEEELKDLLHQQRILCIGRVGMVESTPEPKLPKKLSEWGVVNKIFRKKE